MRVLPTPHSPHGNVLSAAAAVKGILLPLTDILEGRVSDEAPPPWCDRRGWTGFLLRIAPEELQRCEAEGLAARLPSMTDVPPDLASLGAEVAANTSLPRLLVETKQLSASACREVTARKRLQLPALIAAVGAMAGRAGRIVDVGSGSGHFTRLAAATFGREAVGIERDPVRVARAADRAKSDPPGEGARFVALDACRAGISLLPDDLAVGLHACGELGDHLVMAVAEAQCDLALVSCCLQKIGGPTRTPLSQAAKGLVFARGNLGLTNLTAGAQGVEASLEEQVAAREARYALRRLLTARGVEVSPGEEMKGINRRRARAGLGEIARAALALRGLPAPSAEEVHHHEEEARRQSGAIRRLSLPRHMLARVVELAVVLDRAAALVERGAHAEVAMIFDRGASPRNLGLFASWSAERLPKVGWCRS